MSTAAAALTERFEIAGQVFHSRLIIGTGKYRSYDEMKAAHISSGAEMVTVAVRRVPLDRSSESFLDHLDPSLRILPNTAGCYTADEAIRTARLGREAGLSNWVKLEVIGDERTLFPDNEALIEATRILVPEGFVVDITGVQAGMGTVKNKVTASGRSDGPRVRVVGRTVLGNVVVRHPRRMRFLPR